MPYKNGYIKGDRPVTCDICGYDYRFSQMRKGITGSQKGLNVCPPDFDPIHPNDEKRALEPNRPLPEVR